MRCLIPHYHLTYRKRLYLLLVSTCMCFLIGVHFFSNGSRAYNHFLFQIKQPIRYYEQWRYGYHDMNIDCVLSKTDKIFFYEDINDMNVPEGSIFFIETSCRHGRGEVLSARQACSVESAAKMNPARQVFVLIVASVRNRTQSPVIVKLLEYRNIKLVQVDLDRYFEKTPLQNFHSDDTVLNSQWPLSHPTVMSDVLRFVTLYKYGGTYIDLDFFVIRSLKSLHNYAGAESGTAIGASIMDLDRGHWLSEEALRELKDNFATDDWGANRPGIITRLIIRNCGNNIYAHQLVSCLNFKIYPPAYFYPVHWTQWRDYFNISYAPAVMRALRSSYAVHVWNSFTKKVPVRLKTNQPYAQLARQFCPKISTLANDSF